MIIYYRSAAIIAPHRDNKHTFQELIKPVHAFHLFCGSNVASVRVYVSVSNLIKTHRFSLVLATKWALIRMEHSSSQKSDEHKIKTETRISL